MRGPLVWVCGLHILWGLLLFDPKPFIGGDNFWYMLLAEGLRTGEGYRDIWLPGTPPHTHYPPVYPLVLAGVGLVLNSVILLKLLSLAFTTATVALTYALAERRMGDRAPAVVAALLVGSAPAFVEYSHWVLSEPLFVFLVMLSLYAYARDPEGRNASRFGVGAGAALLSSLTRGAGSPLLLAIGLSLASRCRWKRFAVFVLAVLVVAGGWWLRTRWVSTEAVTYTSYGQEVLFRDPYRPELGRVTATELLGRIGQNLRLYTLVVWPQSLGGRDLEPGIAGAVGLVLAVLVAAGALRRVRRLESPELFFWLYLGLILLWPVSWSDQRFLLPLLPLGSIYIVEIVGLAFPARRGARGRALPVALAALPIAFAAFANLRALAPAVTCSRAYWRGDRYACYPRPFVDFLRSATWIESHTEPDAVVVNRKPQILYWVARRRGDVYPFTEDADSILGFLDRHGARYVVVDNLSATTYRYLVPAIARNADRFRIAHQEGNPPTYVLEYLGEGGR
ncbi:MAG: glycosyltransferase family 39 protein [Gemmatimonadetes bacterium]|nr:glycosyltransferase family 39 protein [Gemmatimonadota bacterium]